MNGIIEYDQTVTSLPRFLMIRQLSPTKSYWNIIFMFTSIYYFTITILLVHLWPPKTIDIYSIGQMFIRIEFVVDVTVIFSTYFFLQQLEHRFQTLNDSWEYLLPGFLATPGDLTQFITGMTLDKIRLLHAELSDLLRIFSVGYGKILIGFFVFSYINILICFYYIFLSPTNDLVNNEFNFNNLTVKCLPYIFSLQNVIFILSIIIAASRVHEKKRKIISYLRLIRISNLLPNLKIQVKLFMNQISVFESSEITAFGIFNINLNLIMSVLILLVTGLVTIIQMKEHSVMLKLNENVMKFLNNLTKVE
ncbi:uncharacterized protein LOC132943887 [Metopolophium dirhodum]|uniref:uncharacterized protein LOC132943887 n=1 Tax=Metopolophium dirhodum TaxID=44670 RepID=UPI00298FF005|nr:uncharacterized protein LOC132943887 [Metopolophium dirhodum]